MDFGRWPRYSSACRRAVDRLLARGGSLTAYRSSPDSPIGPRTGSWAWKFERAATRVAAVRHVVACSSGTTAIQAMLHASGLPKDSIVVTSPYTFSATAAAILHAGMRLVFADVDETGCLDPKAVDPKAVGEYDAVMPVDLFGRVASRAYHGMILADSCQAVGAYQEMTGALAATWSMNGMKNIPAGEAGALLTDEDDVTERARRWLSHGENWLGPEIGLNGRLNELTACVAYFGLLNVHKMNAWRRRLALELWRGLRDEPRVGVLTPEEIQHHGLYVYPLIVHDGVDRAALVQRLRKLGVEAREGYLTPLHRLPAFRDAWHGPLPVVEELEDRRLVLLFQVRPPARIGHMRWLAVCIKAALDAKTPVWRAKIGRVEAEAF